jgi:CxxC motif-containing protein (DUF1111 family)
VRRAVIFGVLISFVLIAVIANIYVLDVFDAISWSPRMLAILGERSKSPGPPPALAPRATFKPIDLPMASAGERLFLREWTPCDSYAGGDGLGPVYNAGSCVACHFQNGIGGSGGLAENVTMFALDRRNGVLHKYSVFGREESLRDVPTGLSSFTVFCGCTGRAHPPAAPTERKRDSEADVVSQRNTTALFGARLIDAIPDSVIVANARRAVVDPVIVDAPFDRPVAVLDIVADSQRAPAIAIDLNKDVGFDKVIVDSETVAMARNERSNAKDSRKQGRQAVAGRPGFTSPEKVGKFGWKAQSHSLAEFVRDACANELGLGNPGHAQAVPLFDKQAQAKSDDLTEYQCDQITEFIASLPRPRERLPVNSKDAADAMAGKILFRNIGCSDCHIPDLGPVDGLYSDLLLHNMGDALQGAGRGYLPSPLETLPGEWRTPPLWGVADSAPYLHDGRAATLEEAIRLHDGEGIHARERFDRSTVTEKRQLLAFLGTLRAPVSAKKLPAAERARDESAAERQVARQTETHLLLGGGFCLVLAGLALRSRWR